MLSRDCLPSISDLVESARLNLFGGKGGVGKSTVAAALAVQQAKLHPELNILLVSLDPAHSLLDVFDPSTVRTFSLDGHVQSSLVDRPNLRIQELDFSRLNSDFYKQYAQMISSVMERGSLLSSEDMESFVQLSLPAIGDLMAMLILFDLLESGQCDLIVADTAPTGHTLRLLDLPGFLTVLVGVLNMVEDKHRLLVRSLVGGVRNDHEHIVLERLSKQAEKLAARLRDPAWTAVFAVTLAEHLSVAETRRFSRRIVELGMSFKAVLVNQLANPNCPFCALRYASQEKYMDFLSGILPLTWLSADDSSAGSHPTLSSFALSAEQALSAGSAPSGLPAATAAITAAPAARALSAAAAVNQGSQPACLPVYCVPLAVREPGTPAELLTLADSVRTYNPASSRDSVCYCMSRDCCADFADGKLPDFISEGLSLVIFAGKGGVGKTTSSAASGFYLARQHPDRRILMVSIDPAHSLADSLNEPVGPAVKQIDDNLFALELDAASLLAEFKAIYESETIDSLLKLLGDGDEKAGLSFSADRAIAEKLIRMDSPDLDEFMVFRKLQELIDCSDYDLVILDPAPSGHLLRFLSLPELARDWIKAALKVIHDHNMLAQSRKTVRELLDLLKSIKRFQELICDAKRTRLVAVCTARKSVADGTREMLSAVRDSGISCREILLNMLSPALPDCELCRLRQESEQETIASLSSEFENLKLVRVGLAPRDLRGRADLSILGGIIYAE
jgi:arsenite/tail-anchored protein-transporting ATPase